MKVVVANQLVPGSRWAHDINVIKMAYGFAQAGHQTTLICLRLNGKSIRQCQRLADQLYGTHSNLEWRFAGKWWSSWMLHRNAELFCNTAVKQIRQIDPDFVYARDYLLPGKIAREGYPAAVESHAHPGTDNPEFFQLVADAAHDRLKCWVTISENLGTPYVNMGVPRHKVIILPDAVDLDLFRRPEQLPPSPFSDHGRPNVVYTGHLYDYKGIPTILETAALCPKIQFHLVGGWPEDIERHQQTIQRADLHNVTLHGLKQHKEIPAWLWHADLLLLPPSANHPSASWTSPMKLGEYLASGTPVISTDIPALRRWLDTRETLFVAPDDAKSMARGIKQLLKDDARRGAMVRAGLVRASVMSYQNRAEAILSHGKS